MFLPLRAMPEEKSLNFLEEIVEEDLKERKYQQIITRFPPEPNGYLHIGHATSICLNFGLTKKYGGSQICVLMIPILKQKKRNMLRHQDDVKWLGFDWKNELYASRDYYFGKLYEFAHLLIQKGLAYVDDLTAEEVAEMKGTPTQPGTNSRFRERSPEENKELFEKMKQGAFPDGTHTLRAKIDMAHTNMLMRDPLLYRIKHAHHHRTGDEWCIYPLYDFVTLLPGRRSPGQSSLRHDFGNSKPVSNPQRLHAVTPTRSQWCRSRDP